nr:MAG TPA: hypothetical protein [Caudoviricetes sp.]
MHFYSQDQVLIVYFLIVLNQLIVVQYIFSILNNHQAILVS